MLVGDLIMNVRSLCPDPPQVLGAPSVTSATATTVAGGTLGPATYFLKVTALTPWGETTPSLEIAAVVGGGQNAINLAVVIPGPNLGATAIRVYANIISGQESAYQQFSVSSSITYTGNTAAATPPVNNRAFLPDTDGGFAGAFTFYQWMNDALRVGARVTGGIQDVCGIASVSGMRRYVAPGQWLKFNQCFYDGWELDLGNKAETFRNRNLTANISISLMVDAQSDTTRIELYWTPSRTSGSAFLTVPLSAGDSQISLGNINSWLLQDGFAQLGIGNGGIWTLTGGIENLGVISIGSAVAPPQDLIPGCRVMMSNCNPPVFNGGPFLIFNVFGFNAVYNNNGSVPAGTLLLSGTATVVPPSNSEIVSYSALTGNQMQNIIRGWAGTQASNLPINAAVRELNIELNGYRMPSPVAVGDSALTLSVPPGWEPFLKDYLLGTFRKAEQETQEGQGLQEQATKALDSWVKSNKPVAGPRQMRMFGDGGLRGLVPGGLTGGIIIP